MTRFVKLLVKLVVASALVVGIGAWLSGCSSDAGPQRPGIGTPTGEVDADFDYLIPAGTGARLDAGERIEIIPAELNVRVGDVLRIVNEDERGHVIGAFYVAAGETLTQTFSSPGELSGECSVHPSGSFVLTVSA